MKLLTLCLLPVKLVYGLNLPGLNLPEFPTFNLPNMPGSTASKVMVAAPANFSPASRKPLTVTSVSQLPSLLTGSLSLAARLGSGAFVLGWQPSGGEVYSLSLGPVEISDSSSVLTSALSRGIKQPLVLYEYEPSPYCKKVREVCCLLDIPVLMKPCPITPTPPPAASSRGGATPYIKKTRGGFSDELYSKTGRRTVPYLEDPNIPGMEGMFESEVSAHT